MNNFVIKKNNCGKISSSPYFVEYIYKLPRQRFLVKTSTFLRETVHWKLLIHQLLSQMGRNVSLKGYSRKWFRYYQKQLRETYLFQFNVYTARRNLQSQVLELLCRDSVAWYVMPWKTFSEKHKSLNCQNSTIFGHIGDNFSYEKTHKRPACVMHRNISKINCVKMCETCTKRGRTKVVWQLLW